MGAPIRDIQEGAFVRACLQDDRAAVEALYRAFNPRLVRLLKRRVGDALLAEDLAQETLIKALKGLDRFDPSRPLWPWLRAIALNQVIDHGRKAGPEVPCEEIYGSTLDPAERTDESIMLDQALGALPGRHRAALSLRYLNDWKPTEAAQFLGMSRPAFDQLLSRAKRRLGIEYRRMNSGLQGILVLQAGRIRGLFRGGSARISRRVHVASTDVPPSIMTSLSQVLTATAVVITAVAAQAPTVPSARDLDRAPPANVNRSAEGAAKNGKGPQRTHGPTVPLAGSGHGIGSNRPVPEASWEDQGPRGVADKAGDFVDPNKDVDDPEDATLTSFAFGSEDGSVVYAAGKTHCRLSACPPVLFRSEDGGANWTRLDANGFNGSEIAVPPGSQGDNVLFAMGPSGLQVSRDRGKSFGPALLSGTPMIAGSMAISPEFNEGDPTVLVGADTLLRYSDSTGVMDPYVGSLNGPFEPAFSPDYASNDLFYLGAVKSGGASGMRSVVHTCNTHGCVSTELPEQGLLPRVRPANGEPNLVYAFTAANLFVSRERSLHFNRLTLPWSRRTRLLDLEPLQESSRLLAAVASLRQSTDDGLYSSNDGGTTWTRTRHHLFRSGSTAIAATGSRVIVALRDGGIACSSNAGRTFGRRCTN